jgi:WD40 repeat protein
MHAFALSDTGRLIGTRSAADSTIHVWDTAAGQLMTKINVGHGHFNFGPGGQTVVTTTTDRPERATRIAVWDAATGKRLHDFAIPRELGEAARLSPGGKTIATPKRGEMLCLWDAATGQPRLASAGHNTQVTGLAFADGGAVLVSADRGGEVRTWDVATGAHRAVVPADLRPFAVLPGGRELLADRGGLRRFELATGRPLGEPFSPPALAGLLAGDRFRSTSLALSADGRSVTGRGYVQGPGRKTPLRYEVVWDMATGRPTAERALAALPKVDSVTSDWRTAIAYEVTTRPASPEVAKAGFPGESTTDLRAFDGLTGRLLMGVRVPDQFTYHYLVSPDGQTVATVSGRRGAVPAHPLATLTVRLWEVRSGQERAAIPLPSPGHYDPHAIAFSADGRLMAVSRTAGRIEVIDLATGRELVSRAGYESPSYRLAFRPDGRRLASGHVDGTILVWDVPAPPTQAASAEALEGAWTDLASADAGRTYAATWALASSPGAAVTLLGGRLKPADPAVLERVRARVADLDSKSFSVREAAAAELGRLAGTADTVLRDMARGGLSAEQSARLHRLLDGPAVVRSTEDLRTLRAIEVLERVGTPEAVAVLKKLAGGAAELRPMREARAALERLAGRVGTAGK